MHTCIDQQMEDIQLDERNTSIHVCIYTHGL